MKIDRSKECGLSDNCDGGMDCYKATNPTPETCATCLCKTCSKAKCPASQSTNDVLNVGEFIELLKKYPKRTPITFSSDAEGNDIQPYFGILVDEGVARVSDDGKNWKVVDAIRLFPCSRATLSELVGRRGARK